MRYIQRQSAFARGLHWIHTIACLSLFATGLMLFIPQVAGAVGPATMNGARLVHRVMAAIFIAAPILGIIINPKGFKHFLKSMIFKWDDDDKEFTKKFFPYLLFGAKQHMPPQREQKSGQVVADGAIVIFSILISLTGIVLVWPATFGGAGSGLWTWSLLLHDVSMVLLSVLLIAHIYIGAGIFKPYRGMGRLMFGDGKVSETDALYHWATWAKEELRKGDKVTTA